MKKVAMLVLAVVWSVTSYANLLWVTNNDVSTATFRLYDEVGSNEGTDLSITSGSVGYLDTSEGSIAWTHVYSVEWDNLFSVPSPLGTGDWFINWELSGGVPLTTEWAPLVVPEPSVAVLFTTAFGLFFVTGLTGWGGSFVRTLVVGGNNE